MTTTASVLDDDALIAAIARTFAPAALAGKLMLSHVSAMLGLAPRSLQRRLSILGLRFEELVDEWRRDLSCRMLVTTEMPVGDVGRLLGYSDPAHFTRAFHRWHRTSPGLWRSHHG